MFPIQKKIGDTFRTNASKPTEIKITIPMQKIKGFQGILGAANFIPNNEITISNGLSH